METTEIWVFGIWGVTAVLLYDVKNLEKYNPRILAPRFHCLKQAVESFVPVNEGQKFKHHCSDTKVFKNRDVKANHIVFKMGLQRDWTAHENLQKMPKPITQPDTEPFSRRSLRAAAWQRSPRGWCWAARGQGAAQMSLHVNQNMPGSRKVWRNIPHGDCT